MGSKASAKGKPDKAAASIVLPADCRLAFLDELLPQLRTAASGETADLDGGAVDRLDGAAMQLLVAFRRAATAGGCVVSWAGVSDALREATALLGLGDELNLPAPMPA